MPNAPGRARAAGQPQRNRDARRSVPAGAQARDRESGSRCYWQGGADHLARAGKWDALAARIDVQHGNVSEAANAVQIGSRDATFVWDAVAVNYPDLSVIHLPELAGAIGRVELAVLAESPNPEGASRFARLYRRE